MQTSMPSMQLSLAATEQQPPSIRTQYAYVQGTSAPPQLSVTTTSMGSSSDHGNLSVPRYVDSNPRPNKSPRHASHQSVSSSSNETSEYRYGPPGYVPVNSNSNELNSASTYSAESASAGAGASSAGGAPSSAGGHSQQQQQPQSQQPPPRDYYPPTTSWTTTAGEQSSAPVHSYHTSGGAGSDSSRPYAFPGKSDHPPPPGSYASTLNHYSWSPT